MRHRQLEVTDQTERQLLAPIYRFPVTLANGSTWHFDPGESIYIFTGHGENVFVAKPSDQGRPQFHFYWNRDAMVWNNSGDRVYLRSKDGLLVAFPFPVP